MYKLQLSFPEQKRMQEHASMLASKYTTCLVVVCQRILFNFTQLTDKALSPLIA
jgi:hypothetical protein